MSARTPVCILASIVVGSLLLLADGGPTIAGPESKTVPRGTSAVIANVLSAWRRADARAIAAEYESDGDFVSPAGDHASGGAAIAAFYEAAFAAGYAGSNATATVVHARDLSTAFALIDGYWTIQPTAASKIKEPESGLFVAVLHRHDGRWRIAALREQTSARTLRELESSQAADHP